MADKDAEIAELRARLRAAALETAAGGAATVRHLSLAPQTAAFQPVDPGLAFGIFILPWVFVWFLLDAGYSTRSRLIGFLWLGAYLTFGSGGLAFLQMGN
ncbi:hypothetical protein [Phenylobacterium sp.]|jgi:hypothetical protein|uniref:hypothetical protein n=1 Tax=Phenylobacterium sp. TaxID=1871053 RepID=UPI002E306237|nr:hypothetical protein [Phenylobacterium sp.]HEX3364910.1 hypothetical protein [Phenylobacterium sp.]